jgi:hypothetical protein
MATTATRTLTTQAHNASARATITRTNINQGGTLTPPSPPPGQDDRTPGQDTSRRREPRQAPTREEGEISHTRASARRHQKKALHKKLRGTPRRSAPTTRESLSRSPSARVRTAPTTCSCPRALRSCRRTRPPPCTGRQSTRRCPRTTSTHALGRPTRHQLHYTRIARHRRRSQGPTATGPMR